MPIEMFPNTAAGKIVVAPDYLRLCEYVAGRISALVRAKPTAVMGLATGATPLGVYDILARDHRETGLDFSRVTCFNLDEYYPMPPASPHSYHSAMATNLFSRINCNHWSVPNGRIGNENAIAERCRRYEYAISAAGGIDLQLLGIGRTGHLGFNEPGSRADARTRLVRLHDTTREDAADAFGGIGFVPTQAISMGLGTILEAREILLMASGLGKAEIVRQAWLGPVTEDVPASLLQCHSNAWLCLDRASAAALS